MSAHPVLPLAGRILLALLFFVGGYNKLMSVAGTAGYFGKIGLPMPELLVWLVIAIELGGALLVVIGWQTRPVAWAMAIFTIATGLVGHRFWAVDPAQFGGQLTQFLKNLGIAGGFLLLAFAGPGRISLDRG